MASPRRSETSTPLQDLALLNGEFMEHAARQFAERLEREAPGSSGDQVRRAYALAYGRPPSEAESTFAVRFISRHGLPQLCLVMLNTNEFLFVD